MREMRACAVEVRRIGPMGFVSLLMLSKMHSP
jgi:hypothetical protein